MLTYQDGSGSDSLSHAPRSPAAEPLRPMGGLSEPAPVDGACGECEEMLIVDHRANVGPAEWVEHKLSSLLNGASLPVSHARLRAHLGTRSHC